MKIDNVLKVADIASNQLNILTIEWLKANGKITYSDNVLHEDIYNIYDTLDDNEEIEDCPEGILFELNQIKNLLDKKDCGYLRIIY